MTPIQWYYARGNQQLGPVTALELKQLAEQGQLAPTDLVWRDGLNDWMPARKVRGLFETSRGEVASTRPPQPRTSGSALPPRVQATPPEPTASDANATSSEGGTPVGPPATRTSEAVFLGVGASGEPSHPLEHLLSLARACFSAAFVEVTATLFARIGHYALYAAMALLIVRGRGGFGEGGMTAAAMGLVGVVLLLVLQYADVRFLATVERFGRARGGRLCTRVAVDVFSLLAALTALVGLIGLTVTALVHGAYGLLVVAVAVFVVAQYAALVALHLEPLGVEIDADTPPEEEALGLAVFAERLVGRVLPVAFGVGIVSTLLMLLGGSFLLPMLADDDATPTPDPTSVARSLLEETEGASTEDATVEEDPADGEDPSSDADADEPTDPSAEEPVDVSRAESDESDVPREPTDGGFWTFVGQILAGLAFASVMPLLFFFAALPGIVYALLATHHLAIEVLRTEKAGQV